MCVRGWGKGEKEGGSGQRGGVCIHVCEGVMYSGMGKLGLQLLLLPVVHFLVLFVR